jgi:hypothetical protein
MKDNVESVVVPAVICRWASECVRATQCSHGVPHEADSHCEDPCVCYDIQPSRRAWCVLYQPKPVLDTYLGLSVWILALFL